jgi:membrane-associated phospholipid phosphatase
MKNCALLTTIALTALAGAARADVVTEWNALALEQVRGTATAPPPTTRILAMMHTAMYNAVNGAGGTREQYAGGPTATGALNRELAAAKAARDVLAAAFPTRVSTFDARLNAMIASAGASPTTDASLAFGQSSAAHIIALRTNDGSSTPYTYTPAGTPGRYAYTGATQTTARFNQFADTTGWVITSGSQFRPAGPAALNSTSYALQLEQVRSLGSATSTTRTQEQTDIARFWAAGGGTVTPPGMWNQIAATLATSQSTSLEQNALMFATLNMGLADASITAWDAKRHYDNWRPVTAIRLADLDGNPLTSADPLWQPLLATPEFQAYVSGHSTFSAAGATILATIFGDNISFTLTDSATGLTRSFDSLWAAAEEAGMSRIYGGIHFMDDNTDGLALGRQVGLLASGFIPAPGAAALLGLGALAAARRRR